MEREAGDGAGKEGVTRGVGEGERKDCVAGGMEEREECGVREVGEGKAGAGERSECVTGETEDGARKGRAERGAGMRGGYAEWGTEDVAEGGLVAWVKNIEEKTEGGRRAERERDAGEVGARGWRRG